MTLINALRMAAGFALVAALVLAGTVLLDRRESQITSDDASIASLRYDVGTDYAGVVTEVYVADGDSVATGDPIVAIRSLALAHDVEIGIIVPAESHVEISEDGRMLLTASEPGFVTDVARSVGAFVQSGDVLATVEQTGSLYVASQLDLSPRDYGRLEQGAEVTITLPDRTQLTGRLEAWDVTSSEERALVVAEVRSDALWHDLDDPLRQAGTPVTVSVALRGDGALNVVRTSVVDFLRKVGL